MVSRFLRSLTQTLCVSVCVHVHPVTMVTSQLLHNCVARGVTGRRGREHISYYFSSGKNGRSHVWTRHGILWFKGPMDPLSGSHHQPREWMSECRGHCVGQMKHGDPQ